MLSPVVVTQSYRCCQKAEDFDRRGGQIDVGMEKLVDDQRYEVVETDVYRAITSRSWQTVMIFLSGLLP